MGTMGGTFFLVCFICGSPLILSVINKVEIYNMKLIEFGTSRIYVTVSGFI
jgi:hypothetical protein